MGYLINPPLYLNWLYRGVIQSACTLVELYSGSPFVYVIRWVPPMVHDDLARESERWQRLKLELNAAQAHLFSTVARDVQLANRLLLRRRLRSDTRPLSELSEGEQIEREAQQGVVAELEAAIDLALTQPDHIFLRALSKAAERLEAYDAGNEMALSQPATLAGSVVLAFSELKTELGRNPGWLEGRNRVQTWQREGGVRAMCERNWRIIKEDPFIAALFRKR